MKDRKFWKWRNLAEGEPVRVLELYGTIAEESWFDDDVTPKMFHDELFSGTGDVVIWINSPGGDCVAASQIYTMLMDYEGKVTVKIDGIAASAASVVAMFGDHTDMKKAIEMLDQVKESIINAYEIRTGLSRDRLSRLMDSETWMNAHKAIEMGFADALIGDGKGDADEEPYSFSQKQTNNALINKIATKAGHVPVEEMKGRSVNELMERLSLLRY